MIEHAKVRPPRGGGSKATNKITIEALRYYVPLFQQGEAAEIALRDHAEELTPAEANNFQALMKLKQLATLKVAALGGPLITRELNKLIAGSHLRSREDVFSIMYYAGLDGMKRGLRKFDVEKINSSSTNYLFQWIVTYARKELVALEAPFGIPPSRFQRYKKISAVRKRMTEQLGHYASNEEVYDYFQSGAADLVTMNGRLADRGKPSKANLAIDLKIIEEQETFEKNMLNVNLIDPLEPQAAAGDFASTDQEAFGETVFGLFVNSFPVKPLARIVLMSMLAVPELTREEVALVKDLPAKDYKKLFDLWTRLIKDPTGPFYTFLKEQAGTSSGQFDVGAVLRAIEAMPVPPKAQDYSGLFKEKV